MEQIIITDGYTLNPGDLSWKQFNSFGNVKVFDRTSESEVAERCKDATVLIVNKTPINTKTIANARSLKVIAVTATGYNIVDIESVAERNIVVCNVPGYGTDSVAQHAFALLLELTNHVGENARSVADGEWSTCPDFCYTKSPIVELSGKTLGIVGLGKIGRKMAEIGKAFGMKVIYHSASSPAEPGVNVSLEELFKISDAISIHSPLRKDNQEFVNYNLLSLMKPSAYLINTARGQLINEKDLARALSEGKLKGAALDVLSKEPPSKDNPLLYAPNCIITPHNAWLSFEARQRIMNTTFENVRLALEGKPQNKVN